MKKLYKNNEFDISAPTRNDKFELPDRSYFVSDIQDYFDYIIKNLEKKHTPLIRIYGNKIENRMTFRIKKGYYLELLMPETMKLFGITKKNDT